MNVEQRMIVALNTIRFPEDNKENLTVFPKALNYIFNNRKNTLNKISNHEIIFLSKSFLKTIEKNKILFYECLDILTRNIHEFEFEKVIDEYEGVNEVKNEVKKNKKVDKLKPVIKTVYEDKQNSHNSVINQSVLKVAMILCKKYNDIYNDNILEGIYAFLIQKFKDKAEVLLKNMSFINENTSYFSEDKYLTLKRIFVSVWFWISEHKDFEHLQHRFVEEIEEMNDYCTTGHLARLINVIQGYTDTDELNIKISLQAQCDSVVKQYLTTKLIESSEKIQEGLLTGNDEFIAFVRNTIKDKIREWILEYGRESFPCFRQAINSFCRKEIFRV